MEPLLVEVPEHCPCLVILCPILCCVPIIISDMLIGPAEEECLDHIIALRARWLYLVMSYKLASFRLNFYLNFW